MARTTNEFGGGEIVPAIEAITGIQAPVMADFVQPPSPADVTVENEHGIERRFQNLRNNLKSSSGIERIPFNGIEELDTEQGPNGETVHALNTGDSRIRFVGNSWEVFTNASRGTQLRTDGTTDFIEVTFFGTGLNILIAANSGDRTIIPVVDGVTGADIYVGTFSDVLEGSSRNTKLNQVLPVRSGLTAGVHTIRLSQTNASTGTRFGLYGCEIINENAAIAQQPGADFDGRVELLATAARDWPIKPLNTTITARNDSSGADIAFSGTVGARVLNYLTSGGQQKQVYEPAVENLQGPVGNVHTLTFNAGTTSTVTIPASYNVSNLSVLAFGAGGSGGGGAFAQVSFLGSNSQFGTQSGGGGAGGGRAFSDFTNSAPGSDLALTVVVPGAGNTAAGDSVLTGSDSGTAAATDGNDGGNATVSVGATQIIGATGGEGGEGGNVFAEAGTGGVNSGTTDFNGGDGGTTVGVGQAITDDTMAISGTTLTPRNAQNSGTDQMIADNAKIGGDGGTSTDTNTNIGGGAGGNGARPGADHDGGAGGSASNGGVGTGTAGEAGSLVLIFSSATGTALTGTNFTDAVVPDGLPEGAALSTFGNDAFNASRARQEVIRRINFREFGANTEFALDSTGSTGSSAFTLDDGTTTLVRNLANIGTDSGDGGTPTTTESAVWLSTSLAFITITFVGTGLDVIRVDSRNTGTASVVPWPVSVDGFTIGALDNGTPSVNRRVVPIVSGLAYGTHTVQFGPLPSGTSFDYIIGLQDFIIYGPKRPEIPELDAGSLELSDYNVMADHSDTPSSGDTNLGKGLLRKIVTREMLYSGTWSLDLDSPTSVGGVLVSSATSGSELNYTFYGTGLEFRFRMDSGEILEFDIDGVTRPLATADFVGVNAVTFSNSTSGVTNGRVTKTAAGNSNDNAAYIIDDLTLGVHTFTVRLETAAGNFFAKSLDIITPIHINEDTLKIGSEGLNNLTIDPVVEEDEAVVLANLGEAKAWIKFDVSNSAVESSFNISAVASTSASSGIGRTFFFDKPFKDSQYVATWGNIRNARLGNTDAISVDIGASFFNQENNSIIFGYTDLGAGSGSTAVTIMLAFYGELIDE